jgi:hypothetical protein
MAEIPEDRNLSEVERTLIQWLLAHGHEKASSFAGQVVGIRVISRCACGCASINFDCAGHGWRSPGPMTVLSDYQWQDPEGRLFGVFLFSKSGHLAGLDVWSIDGLATPVALPDPAWLAPFPS